MLIIIYNNLFTSYIILYLYSIFETKENKSEIGLRICHDWSRVEKHLEHMTALSPAIYADSRVTNTEGAYR